MPLFFVNPSRGRARTAGRARVKLAKRKGRRKMTGAAKAAFVRKMKLARRRKSGVKPAKKRRARRARLTKRKARKNSAIIKKRRRSKPTMAKRKTRKRNRAGRYTKKHRSRRRAALKGIRRRKARKASSPKRRRRRRKSTAAPKRRRRRSRKSSTRRRRRKSTKTRRSRRKRSGSKRRRSRRKRSTKTRRSRRRRSRPGARKTLPMHGAITLKMNPGRRRRRRHGRRLATHYRRRSRGRGHYRRNPGGAFVDVLKQALPVVISFYGARAVANFVPQLPVVGPMIGGLGTLAKPVGAGVVILAAHFGTKKVAFLAKHRSAIMLGAGIAFLDSLFEAFAPASVKSLVGVGDIYDRALSDYVAVSDYVSVDGTPLDDNIALSDYVSVDGYEEELGAMGAMEEELGLEEELGSSGMDSINNGNLGGVHRGSMLAPVGARNFLGPVPGRSWTKPVAHAGAGYDNPGVLYNGVFRGGF